MLSSWVVDLSSSEAGVCIFSLKDILLSAKKDYFLVGSNFEVESVLDAVFLNFTLCFMC